LHACNAAIPMTGTVYTMYVLLILGICLLESTSRML